MTRRVVKAPQAVADLEGIWLDGAGRFGLGHADRLHDDFERTFGLLAAHPFMGADRSTLRPGLRAYFRPQPFVIVYRIAADCLEIVRVFHGKQDYESLLLSG